MDFKLNSEYWITIEKGKHDDIDICIRGYLGYDPVAYIYLSRLEDKDYFQHDMNNGGHHGLVGLIHDFLIDNIQNIGFDIANIYSTNLDIDSKKFKGLSISQDAMNFWERRKTKGKAEYVDNLNRYRILFN